MKSVGDFQFSKLYADSLKTIVKGLNWPQRYAIGGSSAGGPAALACVDGMDVTQRKAVEAVILIEPSGLKKHGVGKKGRGSIPLAFSKHILAYRHRISRGWWTPMDKEQYFHRKGKMFEYRAQWWASDFLYQRLLQFLADPSFPPIRLIFSSTSHIHSKYERDNLKAAIKKPHQYIGIIGNHDKICQPPSLSKLYSNAINSKT